MMGDAHIDRFATYQEFTYTGDRGIHSTTGPGTAINDLQWAVWDVVSGSHAEWTRLPCAEHSSRYRCVQLQQPGGRRALQAAPHLLHQQYDGLRAGELVVVQSIPHILVLRDQTTEWVHLQQDSTVTRGFALA